MRSTSDVARRSGRFTPALFTHASIPPACSENSATARAIELAGPDGDARLAEMVLRESRRIVRRRGSLLIAETHHGFICASAGIDRSNAPGAETVVLLPVDPDGYMLRTTQVAVADELAAAADLVLGKLERVPAALVRGYAADGEGTARELIRESERDLFI